VVDHRRLVCPFYDADHRAENLLPEDAHRRRDVASKHFLGAPFGGYKQSGIGREECLEELISFTQEGNININLAPPGKR
jgi:hypothetical protein